MARTQVASIRGIKPAGVRRRPGQLTLPLTASEYPNLTPSSHYSASAEFFLLR